jgi:pilus assembly protein TadC
MTLLPPLLAALAVASALSRPAVGMDRLATLAPVARPVRAVTAPAACGLAGAVCALLIGLPGGLLPGLLIATLGPALMRRLEPASVRRDRQRLVADLPLTLDLLAACLAGGSALTAAAGAVSAALPGPCGDRLAAVANAVAVGTPAEEAWLALSAEDPDDPLAACARVLSRAADGGAPIAAAVGRLAAEARAEARAAGLQAAHRVGVLVVAPLGLCFLPAFVLLGVVPVVVALAGPLLASF